MFRADVSWEGKRNTFHLRESKKQRNWVLSFLCWELHAEDSFESGVEEPNHNIHSHCAKWPRPCSSFPPASMPSPLMYETIDHNEMDRPPSDNLNARATQDLCRSIYLDSEKAAIEGSSDSLEESNMYQIWSAWTNGRVDLTHCEKDGTAFVEYRMWRIHISLPILPDQMEVHCHWRNCWTGLAVAA